MSNLTYILQGLPAVLIVYLSTLLIAFPLAIIISMLFIKRNPYINRIISIYTWIFRGTPLMLQLFFLYYGLLPILGLGWSSLLVAVITFVLNYLAYLIEILRGSIEAIDNGQYEAAYVLGYQPWQTALFIIMPQAIRMSLPALSSEAITLIKDTSLINIITIVEVLARTKEIANREASITPYLLTFILYLVLSSFVVVIFRKLEQRFALGQEQEQKL